MYLLKLPIIGENVFRGPTISTARRDIPTALLDRPICYKLNPE
jgi:hypothetical protein